MYFCTYSIRLIEDLPLIIFPDNSPATIYLSKLAAFFLAMCPMNWNLCWRHINDKLTLILISAKTEALIRNIKNTNLRTNLILIEFDRELISYLVYHFHRWFRHAHSLMNFFGAVFVGRYHWTDVHSSAIPKIIRLSVIFEVFPQSRILVLALIKREWRLRKHFGCLDRLRIIPWR